MSNIWRRFPSGRFTSENLVTNTIAKGFWETGVNYYVKNGGNDSFDGLSDATAWETISKINGFSFAAGDTISFKCGSTWRETLTIPRSGTSGGYMIFNSYSTGNNPKIIGSNTTTWNNYSGNVWVSVETFTDPNEVGYGGEIWFEELDDTVIWGVRKAAIINLTAEYDYTWVSNHIYVYSTTDPDTAYSKVEICQRNGCVELNSKNYLKFDYIDLHYSVRGIAGEYPVMGYTGLYVGHAHMSYFGTKDGEGYSIHTCYNDSLFEYNEIHDCGRRGISQYLYGDANVSNIIVQHNEFYHGFHTTGFDCRAGSQSTDDGDLSGIIIRNNLIWDEEDLEGVGTEWIWLQGKGDGTGILSGIDIYNNIMMFSTQHGIGVAGADDIFIYNNIFYGHNNTIVGNTFHISAGESGGGAQTTNLVIKNNIFYTLLGYDTNGSGICVHLQTGCGWADVTADYNIYYRTTGRIIVKESSDEYYMDELDDLYTDHGWEQHGQTIDPLFLDEPSNLHLQESSPAINAGVAISGYDYDYDGVEVVDPPNIGCYEYVSVGAITLTVQDSTHSHVAENVAIIQAYNLIVQDSVHSHVADNLDLIENKILVIQDAEHSHVVDNVILTQNHILAVADSVHEHVVDNVLLTQDHVLVVADSFHVHSVDSPSLIQNYLLIVQDSDHIHLADSVVLVQDHFLVVQDSIHSHIADNVILVIIEDTELVVQNSFHSHIADNAKVYILFLESTVKLMGVITQMELQGEVQQGKLYGVTDEIFLEGKI